MPLFRRSDGTLLPGVSPERRMLALILRGRNESAIYHETQYDITKTRQWLRQYNRAGDHQAATIFHLFVWALGWGYHRRPNLNRFVSGGRIYQRKRVEIAFA